MSSLPSRSFLSFLSLIAVRPFIIVLSTLTLIIVSVNPFLLFKRLSHPHRSCFSYHHWSATTSQTAFTAITSLIHDFIYHRLTLSISGGARSNHQAFHPRLLQVPKRSLSQEEPIPFTIRVSVSHAWREEEWTHDLESFCTSHVWIYLFSVPSRTSWTAVHVCIMIFRVSEYFAASAFASFIIRGGALRLPSCVFYTLHSLSYIHGSPWVFRAQSLSLIPLFFCLFSSSYLLLRTVFAPSLTSSWRRGGV